jgi:O-antigen ligase
MKINSLKEKFIFYIFPSTLFSLIPFFLITGPFLSDLSISLISILFLIFCFKKKNFSYFKNKYFYIFLIFWFYLMFNSLINNFNIDSFKISFFYFRYGVFVIAIAALLDIDYRFIKYFFYCIFICFVILIFDGFYQFFLGENILGYQAPNRFRVSSFFKDEMILGSYLSRLWPIFFGLSIFIFKKKNKLFGVFILTFILSEALIFLSGDRSAFFFINLSAIFVVLFSQKLKKLRLFTLFSSLLIIIAINFFNPVAKERVFDQTLNQMNLAGKENKNNKEQIYVFSKTHHEIYTSAIKMFLDNRIIGIGVKNFRNKCFERKYYVNDKKICFNHPHNTYIQILTETGLIGFLFLVTILFIFCKHIISHVLEKLKKKSYFSDFEICILSGIAIYLWPFVPTGNFFNNWLSIMMILNLPFLIWSRKSNKN